MHMYSKKASQSELEMFDKNVRCFVAVTKVGAKRKIIIWRWPEESSMSRKRKQSGNTELLLGGYTAEQHERGHKLRSQKGQNVLVIGVPFKTQKNQLLSKRYE